MTDAFILGQDVERLIGMTGWISTDPDGAEIPFLLVYPYGGGAAHKMRALASLLGLGGVLDGPMREIPADEHWAVLDEEHVLWLSTPEIAWTHRPVDADWAELAEDRGQIVLTLGLDPFTPRPDALTAIDRYTARGHRLYAGLIHLK